MEILLHVLPDNFYIAVKSLSELVDDKVCIVSTEIMEEHWDLQADRALQFTLTVGDSDKTDSDVVVVPDFGILRLTVYELVSAD